MSIILYSWIAFAVVSTVFILGTTRVERTKGLVLWYHLIFLSIIPCILLLPDSIQNHLFTPLGIGVIATIYPVNESIKAVCSLGYAADNTWLQYWVAQVILLYSFMAWAYYEPMDVPVLYKVQFFYTLWLVLPYTDGSTLLFNGITSFCIGPILSWVPRAMDGCFVIFTRILINISHIFAVWLICSWLNPEQVPLAVISLSTLYPLLASLVSLATTDKTDTSFWLIYWSFFGVFSLLLTILDAYAFINVQSFYFFVLFIMIYLMLPLFRGADDVFRSILIPYAGLEEMLMIYDSHKLKVAAIHLLPQSRKKQVLRMIATSFFEAHEVCEEEEWLRSGDSYDKKLAFKQGYQSIPQRLHEI